MSYFKQIVITVVLVLIMVVAVKLQIDINELNEEKQRLIKERDEIAYQNEKIQNELDTELDDEQIEKIASEKLGLKRNDYQYFYSDSPN